MNFGLTEEQQMIVDAEAKFWKQVESGEPPEPEWDTPHALSAVRRLFPGTTGERLEASEEQERWYAVMLDAMEREASYKATAEGAKAHLLWQMKQAAQLVFADGKALRRKETKRKGYVVADTSYMDSRIVNAKE